MISSSKFFFFKNWHDYKCMLNYENWPSKIIFLVSGNFLFMNSDLKNGCENEFQDNNGKFCS